MKARSAGLLAVGVLAGIGIEPVLPKVARVFLQSVNLGCHRGYVTTSVSPTTEFIASMTQTKCEGWDQDFYEYKLRISPKDGSWFIPLHLLSNGNGALYPNMYWSGEDALTVISQGDEKSGSFVEHLDVGDRRGPRSISLTIVFERASLPRKSTQKDLGAALLQP